MRRLICLVLGHRRTKGASRRQGGHHYADCTRCGATLFREPEGAWRAAREQDYLPRTLNVSGEAETAEQRHAPRRRQSHDKTQG